VPDPITTTAGGELSVEQQEVQLPTELEALFEQGRDPSPF
jgi:hypothetical protein